MATTTHFVTYKAAPLTGLTYPSGEFRQVSNTSPRKKGKLMLRANAWTLKRWKVTDATQFANEITINRPPSPSRGNGSWNSSGGTRARSAAYNKAYAKLRRKLYEGNASLGVTLGSYRQSREMIVARATEISDSARLLALRGRADSRLLRKRQSFSGTYLETIFGWQPLLADIHASCMTVIQKAEVLEWVRGSGADYYEGTAKDDLFEDHYGGYVRCTLSASVRIANPNLWLLERAGMINVGAVAWDLVPWSFVVGMFVNVAAIVNSITDFMGLQFANMSTTYRGSLGGSWFARTTTDTGSPLYAYVRNNYFIDEASRVTGSNFPSPNLQFRVPKANWELAAMASSLMVQRVRALDRIFSFHPSAPLGRSLRINRNRYTE